MNTRAGQTAADIVNNYTAEALADVFYLYGELKVSRKLASVLVKARETKKIETIGDFLEVIKPFTGKDKEKKFLAQVFQALRIEVKDEGAKRDAAEYLAGVEAGRTLGGYHVSLLGRSSGKELFEDRKLRGEVRAGFLRERTIAFPLGQ